MSKKVTPKEKKFEFTEKISETETKIYTKLESELSDKEIDVLTNNIINTFNSCPRKAQEAFIQLLMNEAKAETQVPKVTEEVVDTKEEVTDKKD